MKKRPFDKKEKIVDVPYFGSEKLKANETFGRYHVSFYGDLWVNNLGTKVIGKSGKVLAVYKNENGYLQVHTGTTQGSDAEKEYVTITLHRLVAKVFIPNPENLPEVNHKDGNKFNNCVENLEWCTSKENQQHALKNNLFGDFKGEKNGRSKLTEEQVLDIKRFLREGTVSHKDLAKYYNVSKYTIDSISRGQSWSHVILEEEKD